MDPLMVAAIETEFDISTIEGCVDDRLQPRSVDDLHASLQTWRYLKNKHAGVAAETEPYLEPQYPSCPGLDPTCERVSIAKLNVIIKDMVVRARRWASMRRKEAADTVRARMEGKSSAARREMFKRIKRGYTPPVSMMRDPDTGAFTSNVSKIT